LLAAAIFVASPTAVNAVSPSEPGMSRMTPQVQIGSPAPEELERFIDQFMASRMTRLHAPGAAVVVVKDGHVLLEKGYGYADLQRRTPFSAITRFRAKSVSKTFTATAVMQLAEHGRLDLQAPVTSYLPGFSLPSGNEPPITLNQLLTQTSGIGDRAIGTLTRDRVEATDLRSYLATNMPPRVAASGTVFSYSDHGISLAGLAVEEVSGLPFAQYMQERILGPLAMDRSAFDPPLDGMPDLAVGYQLVGESYRAAPVGYFHVAPAVSLVTSARDMGRFLIAMLDGGGTDHRSILRPETIQLMEARHFALQPSGPGVAYGLYEWPQNGERVLLHGGLGHGFSSLLTLLPERQLGFFIATNSDEPDLRWALLRTFMDHYYPADVAAPTAIADSDLGRFAGVYSDYRYEGRIEVFKELFDQSRITVNRDRTISLSWTKGRWVQVAPLVFWNSDDPNGRIAFQAGAGGRIIRVLGGGHPDDGLVKLSWFRSLQAYALGVLFFATLFLSAVIAWFASALRRFRRRAGSTSRGLSRTRALAGLVALFDLAFLLGIPLLLLPYAGLNGTQLDFGMPLSIRFIFALPWVTLLPSVVLAAAVVLAWRKRAGGLPTRSHVTAIATGALLFPGFLSYWKLFGAS